MAAAEWLHRTFQYRFQNAALLEAALTHRSAGSRHNERLEYLGDAFLNFVIARELFERVPDADEGDLSRLRAALVKGDTLAEIALGIDLGAYIRLGGGELKSGGYRRASILADALEAVMGAILIDGGHDACREIILRLYGSRLDNLPSAGQLRDAKTRLQEYLQARGLALPEYQVYEVTGPQHQQKFTVSCTVAALELTANGRGGSRRRAEQEAATALLGMLEDVDS